MQYKETKPLSKLTNKEWRGLIIALTFFGIFMLFFGIYNLDWDTIKLGLIFTFIGIIAGFVLHYFFGIKIIDLRRDFKHKKY